MKILIAGGGIAGLGAALALRGSGRQVTLFDRDEAPLSGSMDEVFETWQRPGATQLRHSHVFLARLYTLIRDRYPDLLEELLAAGARELKFHDSLPSTLRGKYRPRRRDGDLTILSCRRTTLETVMRRHVEACEGVSIVTRTKVRGVLVERSSLATPAVRGLKLEHDGKTEDALGDLVVDATGRGTLFPEWLGATGIKLTTEEAPAGIIYYTRHYKLREGRREPSRAAWLAPSAGDLGYIKYGVFPADDGHFSVTLSVPEIEEELRRRIVDGDVFDRICASLPGVMRWTDPARSEPIGRVHGMGKLHSIWRDYAPDGVPAILDFFAIGDACVRTNPLYGRGCSIGFLQAHLLADVLRKTDDAVARATLYAIRTEEELRAFYESMVRQDRAAIRLAEEINRIGRPANMQSRLSRSLAEHGVVPAVRRDEPVLRSLMRSLHMLQGPDDWMLPPETLSRILMTWATPRPFKSKFYPGKLGPSRGELYELIRA